MAETIQVWPGIIDVPTATGTEKHTASVRHPSMAPNALGLEGGLLPNDTFTRKRIKEGGLVKEKPDYSACANLPKAEPDSVPEASAPVAPAPALVVRKARGNGQHPADGTGE